MEQKKRIGIYLSGLGNAFVHESAEKYADRFKNEYDFQNPEVSAEYDLRVNRFEFDGKTNLVTNRVCIEEKFQGQSRTIYQFYEFDYAPVLTRSFKSSNALIRLLTLLTKVVVKIGPMFMRLFYINKSVGYPVRFRGQTLYLFFIILVIGAAITTLVPSAVVALLNLKIKSALVSEVETAHPNLISQIKYIAQIITDITALFVFFIPGVSEAIVSVACEFVSASDYLELGLTKQSIQGQLDILIERIVTQEGPDVEICIHSYSFGSLIALDYLFPYGNKPSEHVQKYVTGLVTIGCPFDFIAVYFPKFFEGRYIPTQSGLKWMNVYSLSDALASNFRKKNDAGEAEYSFQKDGPLPANINYDVANIRMNAVTQFFTLAALKAHGTYWDGKGGQSCLRLIISAMVSAQMV